MSRWRNRITTALLGAMAVALVDKFILRERYLRWGATEDEVRKRWPGDELVARPGHSTRAVTIHAPAEEVWPWLVQIGQDRAGFYSYTWLENLALANMRNADRIVPEYQPRNVGDVVWLAPEYRYGGRACMVVAQLVPNRAIVLVQRNELGTALRGGRVRAGIWQVLLEPVAPNATRLVLRGAMPEETSFLYDLVFDPAHFIMERKMMLGIKARAEGRRTAEEASL